MGKISELFIEIQSQDCNLDLTNKMLDDEYQSSVYKKENKPPIPIDDKLVSSCCIDMQKVQV